VSAAACTVPVGTLIAAPFYIEWGQTIQAKVTAKNIVNFSPESDVGGTAIILTNPSAPVGLVSVPAITAATQVGLTWFPGFLDGGSPVIDYTVAYGVQSGSYSTTLQGILTTSYTVTGLTAGTTYKFKVLARNSYGVSIYSNEVIELAAQIPNKPFAPITLI
jgi:hypothetical protein